MRKKAEEKRSIFQYTVDEMAEQLNTIVARKEPGKRQAYILIAVDISEDTLPDDNIPNEDTKLDISINCNGIGLLMAQGLALYLEQPEHKKVIRGALQLMQNRTPVHSIFKELGKRGLKL